MDADTFTQDDHSDLAALKSRFILSAGQTVEEIRDLFRSLLRSSTAVSGFSRLQAMVAELAKNSRMADFTGIASLSGALASLLKDQITNATILTASEQRTITQSIDLIADLCDQEHEYQSKIVKHPLILAIDDDLNARKTMVHSLRRIEYTPVVTGDCQIALKLLEENRFDLVLLDVLMPEMNGFDLIQHIRDREMNKSTPVIFVTGLADFNSRVKSLAAGGADFIAKPFHHLELAVKSETLLLRRALR
jgi:PleD family two-component response regulator